MNDQSGMTNSRKDFRELLERRKLELSARENSPLNGRRILYAEDDMTNAHLMMRILSAKGIKAEFAKNGEAAIKLYAEHDAWYYDAIILDIYMPIINGHEAALAIRMMGRADSRTVPIIAMTASESSEDRELSVDVGMTIFIKKPVDPQFLYSTIEQLLPPVL